MSTTTGQPVRYRKTKHGAWVVFGPIEYVQAGHDVHVVKADGTTKREHIECTGRQFTVDGRQMVYGYLADRAAPGMKTNSGRGGICAECDQPRRNLTECRDSSGIIGLCCPRCADGPDYTRSFC